METPATQTKQAQPHSPQERPGDKQRNSGPSAAKSSPNKVDVSGYPSFTQLQDLTQIFSNYGSVKVEKLCDKFATLNFTKVDDAKAALRDSKKIMIYGNVLTIKAHGKKAERPNKRTFPKSKQNEVIVEAGELPLRGPFLEQVDAVLARVRLSQPQAAALAALYTDLEQVLQRLWPGCTAMPFGSITTGLGIKTSDADCFVSIPPNVQTDNHVNKAKRVLQRCPQIFTEILAIPNANTPIVKFFHIPTKTNCDLSFKTPLGVQNSKLIAFLLYSDPRLIPMAVLIKYWAKVSGFSGSGKLTNYALIMLIIFYLQQPPICILPSVEWLQRDPTDEIIVDHWNTGFMNKIDNMPKCENTSTIAELLGGFFNYYSTYDFQNDVVCPFLGYSIKKDDFKNFEELPNEFERYKNNIRNHYVQGLRFTTPMVIQDPFELCHNVASPIGNKVYVEIDAFLKFAAKAYEIEKKNNCEGFLKKILLEKPILPKVGKANPSFRAIIHSNIIRQVTESDWKSVIRKIVFIIFEQIFKLQLSKVESTETDRDSRRLKEKYTATLTKAVWKRKQFSRLYNMTRLKFLEKQIRITEEIINADKNNINIKFSIILSFNNETRNSAVVVRREDGDLHLFKEFGSYYLSVFYNWFSALLKPYLVTQQANESTVEEIQNENSNIVTIQTEEDDSSCDDEQNDNKRDDVESMDEEKD